MFGTALLVSRPHETTEAVVNLHNETPCADVGKQEREKRIHITLHYIKLHLHYITLHDMT